MVVVDTNVLVYAIDGDAPFHDAALDWLDRTRARPEAWFLTWPIVFEFLHITTHAKVLRRPCTVGQSWAFVRALLRSPGISLLVPTLRHPEVAGDVFTEHPGLAGNILHDAHTAILMREHGVPRICTVGADFERFPFIETVDPRIA